MAITILEVDKGDEELNIVAAEGVPQEGGQEEKVAKEDQEKDEVSQGEDEEPDETKPSTPLTTIVHSPNLAL